MSKPFIGSQSQLAVAFLLSALALAVAAPADPVPLPRAHAHNDYEHPRPLLDALDHGFCSVEADIYLVDGQLLVAHDRDKIAPDRTLEALYLDPLRQRTQKNGGRVFRNGPAIILLIDIKSEAGATYRALDLVLRKYADMLTHFASSGAKTNAVTVIISGNRPRALMEAQPDRYAAMDGRVPDLESQSSTALIPLISDDWKRLFTWRGIGAISKKEREQVTQIVSKAHAQGRLIRFWGAPDNSQVWTELFLAGVDLINTDNLAGFQEFLREKQSKSK